jgi:hypothetical protein
MNGGSDGQLAKVGTDGKTLYLTMDCVGELEDKSPHPAPSTPGPAPYYLSSQGVDRTYVLRSTDAVTWTALGILPSSVWRLGLATLDGGELALGHYRDIALLTPKADGTLAKPEKDHPAPTAIGWTGFVQRQVAVPSGATGYFGVNQYTATITARVPGANQVLLAFPATFTETSGHSYGYQLYVFDPTLKTYAAAAPVQSSWHTDQSLVMHLDAIEVGGGPVLLTWYDIDQGAAKVTLRGRFVFSATETSPDFAVATDSATTPHVFALQPEDTWFGDYKTAGAYRTPLGAAPKDLDTWHYYPMWDEQDGRMHFSHVEVARGVAVARSGWAQIHPIGVAQPRPGPPPVEIVKELATPAIREIVKRARREDEESSAP